MIIDLLSKIWLVFVLGVLFIFMVNGEPITVDVIVKIAVFGLLFAGPLTFLIALFVETTE